MGGRKREKTKKKAYFFSRNFSFFVCFLSNFCSRFCSNTFTIKYKKKVYILFRISLGIQILSA
tara:strand:- start:238 stop:426 length:189 start_codon:yes stop_codon:yes gene_type:complete